MELFDVAANEHFQVRRRASSSNSNMISVQKRKSACSTAMGSTGTSKQQKQQQQQQQTASRKRAKLGASKAGQRSDQLGAVQQQQPQQQVSEESVWIFGLINNIEQLLSTFTAINSAGSTKGAALTSSGSSSPASAPSPGSSQSSSPGQGCSSSSSLPRSPISRQIKFHEYKGPPSAKRQPTQQVALGQQRPMQSTCSIQRQQAPTACDQQLSTAVNQQLTAGKAAGFSALSPSDFGQPNPASKPILQQQQQQHLRLHHSPSAAVQAQQANEEPLMQQPKANQLTSGAQCIGAAAGRMQSIYINQNVLEGSNGPAVLLAGPSLAEPKHNVQEYNHYHHQSRLQDQRTLQNLARPSQLQLEQPQLEAQFLSRQSVQQQQRQPSLGGMRLVAQDQLMTNYQQQTVNEPNYGYHNYAPLPSISQLDGRCAQVEETLYLDGLEENQDQETTDACDLEPSIGFGPADGSVDELIFSEFIDSQSVPLNVEESDWLKKFLPPCSMS